MLAHEWPVALWQAELKVKEIRDYEFSCGIRKQELVTQ